LKEHESSYRNIIKATSVIGGVQIITILLSLVKSKLIAVLLGPEGIGFSALLSSSIGLIGGITYFGLGTSAVKNVSQAFGKGDLNGASVVITVLKRCVWVTGLFGMIVAIFASSLLSQLTFGNSNHTWSFIWISISLLFTQLSTGHMVVLQGMRKLDYLVKSSLLGSILGLIITAPLYYFFGIKGVVPGIIINSSVILFAAWYFSRKVKLPKVDVSKTTTIREGKNILKIGFFISLSGFLVVGSSYLVQLFIIRKGDVNQVGLYSAGFTIINTYVSLIFSALATEYYPRLSSVASCNKLSKNSINQQAEITLIILAPGIMIFLIFINLVVIILYSNKFVAIESMIHWAALGMLFKAASWPISFIFLAKGDSKVFFWNDFVSIIYVLILNVLGYDYFGLAGLGFSFLISYIIYLVQVLIITKIKYDFSFSNGFIYMFSIQLVLAICCFLIVTFFSKPYSYILGLFLIFISSFISFKELEKRIGLISLIRSKMIA
jgi:O-antigen/teichoic acid export membrane protein